MYTKHIMHAYIKVKYIIWSARTVPVYPNNNLKVKIIEYTYCIRFFLDVFPFYLTSLRGKNVGEYSI